MNFLVRNLIIFITENKFNENFDLEDLEKCEEECFWLLCFIVNERNWNEVLVDNTPKLLKLLSDLNLKLKNDHYDIYNHIKNLGLNLELCFSSYFITLLCNDCPLEISRKILELFLMFGEKIIIEFICRILKLFKKEFLEIVKIEEGFCFLKDNLMFMFYEKYQKNLDHILIDL